MPDYSKYSQTVKVMALVRYAGVGPRMFDLLMNHFGGLDEIFNAPDKLLRDLPDSNGATAGRVAESDKHLAQAEAEYRRLAGREIRVVTRFDDEYPDRMAELNDPPPLLYVRGLLPDNARKTVTLVGATNATAEGIALTVQLARRFAEANVQVVSSLRLGIDAAAHLGAHAAGASTFAIVEAGFDQVATPEQMPLAIDALRSGGVISEYPPESRLAESNYVQTNRLLVGISNAVVLTEVYHNSVEVMDLLEFCNQIGKLAFLVLHPEQGPLSDPEALQKMTEYGVIPMNGPDQIDQIILALV